MIIINADDWGRCRAETDAAVECYRCGRITTLSAMVFMDDSVRAARIATENGIETGLHVNFTQPFTAAHPEWLRAAHARIARFLSQGKLCALVYNPVLARDFRDVYEVQLAAFRCLYGNDPTHIDGHHHQHLCANMLFGDIIAHGTRVRRNFHFSAGEKSAANRGYRRAVDWYLSRRYRITDFFFALATCLQGDRLTRVAALAKTSTVELMTHPANRIEQAFLMSESYAAKLGHVEKGTHSLM